MARFDLNLLSALEALLAECNVTRAAERMNVTQPTMSGMLQRLRYQFDDQLLVRHGRGMELTHIGQSLIEPVRDALRSVESLVRVEPRFDPATSTRTFTMMASDYCTTIFMPGVVTRLARIAPSVRLTIQSINTPVERMLSGEVDLCISPGDHELLRDEIAVDRLQTEPLFSDHFVCVVGKDHPLRDGCTLEDYLAFPHVGVQMVGVPSTLEAESLRQVAPQYKPSFLVADFSLVPCMVAQGRLVGLVQERLAQIAANVLPLRYFAPPFEVPRVNESIIWHPRLWEDPAHTWLRALLLDEAAAWRERVVFHNGAGARTPAILRSVN